MKVEKNAQVVLITGCSSGIGFTLSLLLAREANARFKVYASMRNLAKKGALEKEAGRLLGKTLVIKQLDVSVEEQIDDLVEDIIETEGKIDVLGRYVYHFQRQWWRRIQWGRWGPPGIFTK